MQTIEFKLPDNPNIHTFETDDSLWDTWGEVKINGEDWRVNVWYDDPDEGILLSIYPYIMQDGEWVTDYCDFTSCIILNGEYLVVDVKKPEPEPEREVETFVVNTATEDGDDCTYLIKSKLDLGLTDHWGKELLEWLNENGIYGCECKGSEFVTAVTSAKRIDGTI